MKKSDLHSTITAARIEDAVTRRLTSLDNPGFCIFCGTEADSVEPDAEAYDCEHCEAPGVYGADELFIRFFS